MNFIKWIPDKRTLLVYGPTNISLKKNILYVVVKVGIAMEPNVIKCATKFAISSIWLVPLF